MKIFQLKRPRFLKIAIILISIILVFMWFILNEGESNVINSKLSEHREETVFVGSHLGNFEPEPYPTRISPGENGKPHQLSAVQQNDGAESISEYGINMVVSGEISMDRSIPDTRHKECKHWDYPTELPSVSVIIVFHNEGLSTLMRTVHTVVDRSPPEILKEVLLVDDFSEKDNLKHQLEDYISRWKGKVRLIRNEERQGLIRTRTRGAEEARGEVILFLDAHCEVNRNWLPPLLAPIYRDRTVMTVPIIDGIDHNTFEYKPVYSPGTNFRGIFEWGMLYKETEIPPEIERQRKHKSAPYQSPTHAGGLFAIDRAFFLELGGYDAGLLVWGGENFELSFKVWQCGGSIEWVPCSRVGHVYRSFMPYRFGKLADSKKGPIITINYKRVIEVWFDDKQKEYFYTREPSAKYLDAGDLTAQLQFKKEHKCKSFSWFLENVAFDLLRKYPELPVNAHQGELRNGATSQCVDTMGHTAPGLMGVSYCHGFGNNQLIRLNTDGQLGVGERCIDADNQGVKLIVCRLGTVDGPWEYDQDKRILLHNRKKSCLALHPQTSQLILLPCDQINSYHKWTFHPIVPKW